MWKRYECPTMPSLLMFGGGGRKQFSGGRFITDDEAKQKAIEQNDKFGVTVFLVASGEEQHSVSPPPPTVADHLAQVQRELEEVSPVEVSAHDGDVTITGKMRKSVAQELAEAEAKDLTPEQRIHLAFFNAGFDQGTDIDQVLEEMEIDLTLPPAEVAALVEDRLEPIAKERAAAGEAKQPEGDPDVPSRTDLRRMKHDDLMKLAKQHHIPNVTPIMASAKRLRAHLLKHFHGVEVSDEE